ncbi:MAG: ATP-binding cassette domain-containing protein [Solirubrobacterales bacterium]
MLFEVTNVSLVRGGRRVLDGFSAQLPEGASCVSGPSGSGKSTLLRLLNRLADPDSGRIMFRGEDVRSRDPRELRREVCLVPQLPSLVEGSVTDNLRYAAAFDGDHGNLDSAKLLPLAGLDPDYAERDAARLSVGEQQRVMLARALALEPSVLLLDEPTSALDEGARDAVELALAGLRRQSGLSLVVVTHDPAQAERLADHVIRMEP